MDMGYPITETEAASAWPACALHGTTSTCPPHTPSRPRRGLLACRPGLRASFPSPSPQKAWGWAHARESLLPGAPLKPTLLHVPWGAGPLPWLLAADTGGHLGRRPEAAPTLLDPRRPCFCVFVCLLPQLLHLPRTLRFSLPEPGLSSCPVLSRGGHSGNSRPAQPLL